METAPSYVGMLNNISQAETRAFAYLSEWAKVTPRDDVRAILECIAMREGEHGMSFAKRLNELGYSLVETDDPDFERRMQIARSDMSDLQKMDALEVLKYAPNDGVDGFANLLRDPTIDIQTSELLGRYIAEERDTIRMIVGCHTQLSAETCAASPASTVEATDARLARLEAKLDALCAAVERLAAACPA